MSNRLTGIFRAIAHRRTLNRWERFERLARSVDLESLRELRQMARQLRQRVNAVAATADVRLALPVIGSNAMTVSPGTDWSHRPEVFSNPVYPAGHAPVLNKTLFGNDLTIYHDSRTPTLSVRQARNTNPEDLAPFRLALDVFRFDGSFLSFVLQAPSGAVADLKKRHVIRLELKATSERPIEMSARLNLKHGPNTEQQAQELDIGPSVMSAEFDLAYMRFNETRVEQIWVDLFFDSPSMNRVEIRDIVLSRHPRVEV
jgi:hypothetical protein